MSPFTGLYFFSARWYDPVVGRWISRSILPTFMERQYEYNNGNPVYFVDTNGVYGWYPYPGHTEPPKIPDFPIVPTWVPGQKFLDCMGSCYNYNNCISSGGFAAYLGAGMPFLKTAREKALSSDKFCMQQYGSLYRRIPKLSGIANFLKGKGLLGMGLELRYFSAFVFWGSAAWDAGLTAKCLGECLGDINSYSCPPKCW
jgi:hypothetical protein